MTTRIAESTSLVRHTLGREIHVLMRGGGTLAAHLHNMLSLDWGTQASALLLRARGAADDRCWLRLANRPPAHRHVLVGVMEPGGTVWAIAWSPSGDRLASSGSDGALAVWDPVDGRLLAQAPPRIGPASAIAWAPDGKTLATGHDDGTIRFWNPESASERGLLAAHGGGVLRLAWSPDQRWLAAGTGEGAVLLAAEGDGVRHIGGHEGHVYALAWSPDGSCLSTGGSDAAVRLWDRRKDFAGGKVLKDSRLLEAAMRMAGSGRDEKSSPIPGLHLWPLSVLALAWSPDGTTLVSGTRTGFLRFWDPRTATPGDLVSAEADLGVWALTWSPDGELLARGTGEGQVVLAAPAERQQAVLPSGHSDCVRDLAFAPDGGLLASCGDDGKVRLWNARSHWNEAPSMADPTRNRFPGKIHNLAWSGDGRLFGAADSGGEVALCDAETGHVVARAKTGGGPATALAPGPLGVLLLPWENRTDAPVLHWESPEQEPAFILTASGPGTSLALSPDGTAVATGDVAGTVWVTGVEDGRTCGVFLLQNALGFQPDGLLPVWALAWAPDGDLVAAAGTMGLIVWDVRSTTEAQAVLRRPDPVGQEEGFPDRFGSSDEVVTLVREHHAVAWSPDGSVLASSSTEPVIRLWQPPVGEAIGTLEGHVGAVTGLDWSGTGELLASASLDGTVRVWDVHDRRSIAIARCLSPVLAVRFGDDSASLRAADDGSATALRPLAYVFELRDRASSRQTAGTPT